jgi:hypothetical protein
MTKLKLTQTHKQSSSNSVANSPPKTLPDFLETIPDCRRGQGKMHRLPTILLIILMATMSGCFGQRPTGDFVEKHHKELVDALNPKNGKLPSRQTISRVMQHLDYAQFSSVFFAWAKTIVPIGDKDWMSLDGKGISGTLTDPGTAKQQYIPIINSFPALPC